MTTALTDEKARERIEQHLDATLFVEAGAGSGKTGSLVKRVVSIVLTEGVPLRAVAAVTFTEKAAAELRDRLRAAFEDQSRHSTDPVRRSRSDESLDDLDGAAIGTLHAFAQRILGEHPIEAGLPPLLEVSDEVASQVAFEQRWNELQTSLLDDEELRPTLLLGLAAGLDLKHLRSIAHVFNAEWDRLADAVLAPGLPADPVLELDGLRRAVVEVCELERHCVRGDDRMVAHLQALSAWAERLDAAPDDPARLQVLAEADDLKSAHGRKGWWAGCDLEEVRARLRDVTTAAGQERKRVLDRVLRRLAHRIAEATLAGARERQREGALEFHDLLVLARELVRSGEHGRDVRAQLSERYQRLLLDEFQDTDPIQIELALRISGGADADAYDWRSLTPPPGRLFVVGDPKQSIYRFRRADIASVPRGAAAHRR